MTVEQMRRKRQQFGYSCEQRWQQQMGRETAPPEGEEDMEKTAEQETAKTFQRTRMVVMAAAFAALACVATMVISSGGLLSVSEMIKEAVAPFK